MKLRITTSGAVVVIAELRHCVFVKVETGARITGWGEAALEWKTRGGVGCIEDLAPLIVGQDPRRIAHLYQVMNRHAFFRFQPENLMQPYHRDGSVADW